MKGYIRKRGKDSWQLINELPREADDRPMDSAKVTNAFAHMVKDAGFPEVRLHDLRHLRHLRHTHASLMLQAGVHPKVVSERLGHSSVGIILDTYSHVLPGVQEQAAERFSKLLATPDQP